MTESGMKPQPMNASPSSPVKSYAESEIGSEHAATSGSGAHDGERAAQRPQRGASAASLAGLRRFPRGAEALQQQPRTQKKEKDVAAAYSPSRW